MDNRKCNRCGSRIFNVEALTRTHSMMGFQVPQCISCGYEDYSVISLGRWLPDQVGVQAVANGFISKELPAREGIKAA